MISEIVAVELLKNKDPIGLDWLCDQYAPALYGVILKLIPDTMVAADILHKCFTLFWHQSSTYDSSQGKLFSWMIGITIAQCNKILPLSKEAVFEKLGIIPKHLTKPLASKGLL